MTKEKIGIVIGTEGSLAKVKFARHGECSNCGMCPGDNYLVMEVNNELNARIGQNVIIKLKEASMIKASLIIFILPLASIYFGYLLGILLSAQLSLPKMETEVGSSIFALLVAVISIKIYDKSIITRKKSEPEIIHICD